jgi:hypothetical protein
MSPKVDGAIQRPNGLMVEGITFDGQPRNTFAGAFYPPAQDFAGTFFYFGVPSTVEFQLRPS